MGLVSCLSLFGLQLYLVIAAPVDPVKISHLSGVGKFWHISDLHLDPTYHLSDDHTKVCFSSKGVPASNPGPFGDFLCDSPYQLIQSALTHIQQAGLKAQFMIWTGDSPPHVPPGELSTGVVIQVISNMTHTIRHHLPALPVYPALGNHDYWPQDQYPASSNVIYEAAARLWQPWLQPSALETLRAGGFYSQSVQPGLRVVSLNTNLYYSPNRETVNSSDPSGQLQWLQGTLENATQAREKVFVIAHVPVGYLPFAKDTTAIREVHNEQLVAIFRKYSDIIAGQFYGHTHRDSIMVLQDEQGKPVNSLFVSPAVTPIKSVLEPYSNNPGVRMYAYSPEDFSLLDIWQYYLNLTEANESRSADWALEYVLAESSGLRDLRPESLFQLATSFQSEPSGAFRTYFTHFMVSYNSSVVCERDCKLAQVCAVLHLDRESYTRCINKGK